MKTLWLISIQLIISLFIIYVPVSCQHTPANNGFNFGMESVTAGKSLPDGWGRWGNATYTMRIDSVEKYSGKYSLLLEGPENTSPDDFGSPFYAVPAKYAGKRITVKAFIKTEGVTEPIGLLLRIDGEAETLEFDNMMQKGIKGTPDWKEYSVSLRLPEEARTIYAGAILSGPGKLWLDEVQLLIDDKDIADAAIKKEKVYKAKSDTEFDEGSRISVDRYSPETVANLEILGKVWGFLKYYHPAVSTGDYNWDAELFRVMPDVIKASSAKERNKVLLQLAGKPGPVKKGEKTSGNADEIKLQPDIAWIEDSKLLGKELSSLLAGIRDAQRGEKHYYVALTPSVKNPVFQNEKTYAQMSYDDDGVKLLALYRYWNMIQYFFPYRHLTDKNWNSILAEFIPVFLDASSELEYKLALLQLIAQVSDTHANIWGDKTLNNWKGSNQIPYVVTFIEGKAVITGYTGSDPSQRVLMNGDVIISINGQPVEEIIKRKLPYTPASNYETQLRNISRELLVADTDQIGIRYERNGTVSEAMIKSAPHQHKQDKKACYRMLSSDIGYIYPGTIKNDSLPAIMEAFKDTKGFVIDFRCYPSDFLTFAFGAYLMPEPTGFVKFTKGSLQNPGEFSFTQIVKTGTNNMGYYKGKIVIIVNEQTQSSAEYQTMALRVAPGATVIGSITAAADGNVSQISLPGGVRTMISGIGVYYPDGRETQRIGIGPDLEVKPTIKGIAEGKDELLDKAIEIIMQGK